MEQLGAGAISGEGWQTMYMGLVEQKEELKELYETDAAEFFIKLNDFFDIEREESTEEKAVFNSIESTIKELPFDIKDRILCLAVDYSIAAEDNGFRKGFQTAMRLRGSAMKGGVA